MTLPTMAQRSIWDETAHPRGTGAAGGQFVAKGASSERDTIGYDSRKGTGAGFGAKGGDKRVAELQRLLNNLGFTDSAGKPLKVDGKLGPKTTAAIKRLQKKMGLKADGNVSPNMMRRLRAVDHRRHVAFKKGAKDSRKTALAELSTGKTAPVKKAVKKAAPKKAAPKKAAPRKATR